MTFNPLLYTPGDVVRFTQTAVVQSVNLEGLGIKTNNGPYSILYAEMPGEIEMVKRAVRKPKAGDVIPGVTLGLTMWKRGTLIRHESEVLMLGSDGEWHGADGSAWSYSFEVFALDPEPVEILYVAE